MNAYKPAGRISHNVNKFSLCHWRRTYEAEKFAGEIFLKKTEKFCVTACARYRELNFSEDHAWMLSSSAHRIIAMILHIRRTVFPVFNGISGLNIPAHLYRALGNIKIHTIHGVTAEVETLLKLLSPIQPNPVEYIEYYLMALDDQRDLKCVKAPPKGMILRRPKQKDLRQILPLQAAYEQEEVLPAGAILDPGVCAYNLSQIISKERVLVAEINGKIIGKINTNAQAYSRCQIGGVYVLPEYRCAGVASCMTAAFTKLLLAEGLRVSLFVRKKNEAAIHTYQRAGFKSETDYSIVYI
jgi:ribosomal protein S18 acetylase RimI-like enzyme